MIVLLEDLATEYHNPLPPFSSVFLPMGSKMQGKVWREPEKFVNTCIDMGVRMQMEPAARPNG